MRLKCAVCESTLSTADAVPLPQWGRLRYEDIAFLASSKRIHACVEKQYPRQSLPRVGKVASGASRIGFWRYERERGRSSQVDDIREHPSVAVRSPFPNGEGLGGATLRVDFYKRRCPQVVGIAIRRKRISNIWGSQPRLATLDSPFQRKGRECGAFRVYRSLLPMEGGAPKGRRLDGESGMKKSGGDRLKQAIYESTRAAGAVPLPQWGRLRYENTAT